jgi:hypothetical protein
LVDGEVAGNIYSQRPISHFRVFQRKKLVLQLLLLLLPVPEALVGLYIVEQKISCADIYIYIREMMIEVRTARESWAESYKPLPNLSLVLSLVWTLLACIWAINTWSKRRFQRSHLQWVITTVPVLKALVLGLTFVFW